MNHSRREMLRLTALPACGWSWSATSRGSEIADHTSADSIHERRCTIGLSQISVRRMIHSGELDPLDYPSFAMGTFGINEIDIFHDCIPSMVNRFPFLEKLRTRSEQAGTNIFLIASDRVRFGSDQHEGGTGELRRFHTSVDQANVVGAKHLKVYLDVGNGTLDRQTARAVDSLRRLAEYAATKNVSIAVEPGSGASKHSLWLARVLVQVDHPNCGSVPDVGKFCKFEKFPDSATLMASARVISAKTHTFREDGLELQFDYSKLFQMIVSSDFGGIIAIQYEGQHSEVEGIKATQKLLQRLQESFFV